MSGAKRLARFTKAEARIGSRRITECRRASAVLDIGGIVDEARTLLDPPCIRDCTRRHKQQPRRARRFCPGRQRRSTGTGSSSNSQPARATRAMASLLAPSSALHISPAAAPGAGGERRHHRAVVLAARHHDANHETDDPAKIVFGEARPNMKGMGKLIVARALAPWRQQYHYDPPSPRFSSRPAKRRTKKFCIALLCSCFVLFSCSIRIISKAVTGR